MHNILFPAYGRSYACAEDAVQDYIDGKDFKHITGPYCSCRDFPGLKVAIGWRPGTGLYTQAEVH